MSSFSSIRPLLSPPNLCCVLRDFVIFWPARSAFFETVGPALDFALTQTNNKDCCKKVTRIVARVNRKINSFTVGLEIDFIRRQETPVQNKSAKAKDHEPPVP